jgi:hypothetical protein
MTIDKGQMNNTVTKYRQNVLAELETHGVHPTVESSPELIQEFLSDLYRYEIRKLKGRLKRGDFPRASYRNAVAELRKRYSLLSIPVQFWTE